MAFRSQYHSSVKRERFYFYFLHRPWVHRELVKAPHILPKKRRSELIEKNLLGLEAEHELFLVKRKNK